MARIDQVVEAYRNLRDKRAALKKEFELADSGLKEQMETLESYMLVQTQALGVDSFKTPFGTAYKYHATSVTAANWDEAFNFIKANELWNMLEHRVSKTAVEEYREAEGIYPPGLNVQTIAKMGFRAS
jgi:hypothetical protein